MLLQDVRFCSGQPSPKVSGFSCSGQLPSPLTPPVSPVRTTVSPIRNQLSGAGGVSPSPVRTLLAPSNDGRVSPSPIRTNLEINDNPPQKKLEVKLTGTPPINIQNKKKVTESVSVLDSPPLICMKLAGWKEYRKSVDIQETCKRK